nr:immunoglobulin heavy chain junction region [Macaca mulatta]MOV49070.1 immunoglobulin heavy chain junction region [Macaca mulatta]MOV49155.1 immunoglobulin heavy chain junction region [Macaca mulatta]MOV49368.1 immunoglobulin heavy chain junction region [Macaca mulatta]MOV49462.1 immunoglobulin heavy chain junction region [Macaca mulatta]
CARERPSYYHSGYSNSLDFW